MRWAALVLALASASGCHHRAASVKSPLPSPWDEAAYAAGPPPATAKVFLVAGGDDIANFAAEVVEQRRLWREAGLRDDEIACYWAHPKAGAYADDKAQYDALRGELTQCYRADPGTVLSHLRSAAEHDPPWLYVYFTAHGLPSLMRTAAPRQLPAVRKHRLDAGELADLDHHAIGLQAGPAPVLEDVDGLVARYRAGAPIDELMLTPKTLAQALERFDPAIPKVVVIQACFSGGFIADDTGPTPLQSISSLTLLTATSRARPSFGCGAGKARTYYGGAFNRVLAANLEPGRNPATLPWTDIHTQVALVIDAIESIDAQRPSQPGLLQTPAAVGDTRHEAPDDDLGHASELAYLGRRCGTPTASGVAHVCGHGGRVAAIVAPGDAPWVLPPHADVLVDEHAPGPRGEERWVALEGDRLWLRELSCARCARQVGIMAVADLPALDDDARTQLRELLAIPAHFPLRTTDDWRRFFLSTKAK